MDNCGCLVELKEGVLVIIRRGELNWFISVSVGWGLGSTSRISCLGIRMWEGFRGLILVFF